MIPFRSVGGTSSHVTKILVEVMLFPLTFSGAAVGSEINQVRGTYNC